MPRQIGIDLGTTNSAVAYLAGDRAETIPNAEGHKTTPSVVLYRDEDSLVGELAKRQLVAHPRSTARSIKRVIGQRYSEVKDRLAEFPFRVVEGPDDKAMIELDGRQVEPEAISALVLAKLRQTAEDFLGEEVTQAVVTCPAHFNDSQRVATKRAAEMAGLEVLRIINEPTAAALAYGLQRGTDEKVAVFDFGGGTFDISILQISDNIFEVLSTNGDNHLGGDNLDEALMGWIIDEIKKETKCDPAADLQAMQRIRETAEKVKCELSTMSSTAISLPFIVADATGPKHFNRDVTREQFLDLVQPILSRLAQPCRAAMADANLKPEQISTVLLVGGSTRIPQVQKIAKEIFGREPNRSVNPDEAVALGAAIQSSVIKGELQEVLLLDVVPLSLGLELAGGVFKAIIPRNSNIPTTATKKFTTVVDNQSTVLVHVLQGERKMAKENRTLARFRLLGIAPAPREVPEIEVRFHIDANGILQVSAQDLTSGVAHGITIENYSSSVSDSSAVDRAVREAQERAQEDEAFLRDAQKLAKMQTVQHDITVFLEQVGSNISEHDLKAAKEASIRLDIAAGKKQWTEVDAVELEVQLLRSRYASKGLLQQAKPADITTGFDIEGRPAKPRSRPGTGSDTGTGTGSDSAGGDSSGGEGSAPKRPSVAEAIRMAQSGLAAAGGPSAPRTGSGTTGTGTPSTPGTGTGAGSNRPPSHSDATPPPPAAGSGSSAAAAEVLDDVIELDGPGAGNEPAPPPPQPSAPPAAAPPRKFTAPSWLRPGGGAPGAGGPNRPPGGSNNTPNG